MINLSISLRFIKLAAAILIIATFTAIAMPVLSKESVKIGTELKGRVDDPALQPSFLKELYENPIETLTIKEVESIVLVPYNGEDIVTAVVELMYVPDGNYSEKRGYIFLRNLKMQNLFAMAYASGSKMEIVARQTELPEDWPYLQSILAYEVTSAMVYARHSN